MAIEVDAVTRHKLLTADDVSELLDKGELDPDLIFELIDGEVVEVAPVHSKAGKVSAGLLVEIGSFAKRVGGEVFDAQTGFMVSAGGRDLRAPDVSYFGPGRPIHAADGFIAGAPDLAVEVLSRNQGGLAYARRKVREYLDAGAQMVWLVNIDRREVRVYRAGAEEFEVYREGATLTLEPIVAGFSLAVASIFAGV